MTNNKIRIQLVIPNLSPGGAERILAYLAQNLDPLIFESELVVIGKPQKDSYEINNIKVTYLNKDRVLSAIPKLAMTIKNKKPNIVLGTLSHVNFAMGLISILFPKIVFIGRQTSIVKIYKKLNTQLIFDWYSIIEKVALKKLDYIICQSSDMAKDCSSIYNIHPNKIKILNNPITDNFKLKPTSLDNNSDKIRFITVGRLVEVKGHNRIINVLSKFQKSFSYTIIGDGPLKDEIFALAKKNNILENITHIPFTKNVSKYLNDSHFFLQGSLTEGFPNALLESCAVGTPAIAFNVPGGTKEIIKNGVNGYLVNDEEDFLATLNKLPNFEPKSVSEAVYKKFDKAIILKQYQSFLQSLIKKNNCV
ncbi:glycosyltransferase [Maribacter litoralis]|uniref:glycosyltransferase n=1 Tax=Maribacter litoralis TaxID=2059726 RepID=UPI0013E08AEC|nr:glycosyltransferase [Maribacter litoralis]